LAWLAGAGVALLFWPFLQAVANVSYFVHHTELRLKDCEREITRLQERIEPVEQRR
jgi:hypothetical protein